MKFSVELSHKTFYIVLVLFLVLALSIGFLFIIKPDNAQAEWNNEKTSSSDSYNLSQIEKHLEDLVRGIEKLNSNLSDIEDEMEKIRYKIK